MLCGKMEYECIYRPIFNYFNALTHSFVIVSYMLKKLLILWLMTSGIFMGSSWAQSSYTLKILGASKDTTLNPDRMGLKRTFPDRVSCYRYVSGLPGLLQAQGYIAASVDSVNYNTSGATLWLYAGKKYHWGHLVNRIDPFILDQLHLSDGKAWKRGIQWEYLSDLETKVIDYCAMHGYPFAQIGLDSVRIQDDAIDAVLRLNKGYIYKVDSIRVFGKAKISKDFLYRYLDLPPGSIYDQSKLNMVSARLLSLPYVQEERPWALKMLSSGAVLDLYLKPRNNNQVDGMLGVLPTTQADGTTKTQVVGELKLDLQNAFGNGEGLTINWQQLQPQSPRLDLAFSQPYLFHSPVGMNVGFDLLKKDSSWLNVNFNMGASWYMSAQKSLTVFLQIFSSSLLNVDTTAIEQTLQLPDELDMTTVSLGMTYNWRNTNYLYNPRKGNEFSMTLLGGQRHIRENTTITQIADTTFNFASLYDTVPLKSYQFKGQMAYAHYFPVGRQTTLKAALNGGWQISPRLYTNELFQIGGYRLLRGFDEESVYASQYVVGSLEYRILIGMNSYFFAFSDDAWVRNKSADMNTSGILAGFGFGINLETKAGMFNISFAEGEGNGENFNFGNTKVHIGYVNFF
jgi:outer membrane protein assembly factor BamA